MKKKRKMRKMNEKMKDKRGYLGTMMDTQKSPMVVEPTITNWTVLQFFLLLMTEGT